MKIEFENGSIIESLDGGDVVPSKRLQMNYKYFCPSCNSELIKNGEYYSCENQQCELRDSQIEITEDYQDVFVRSEDIEEFSTEKLWCTVMKLVNKN